MPVTVESSVSGPFTPNGVATAFAFNFKADSALEVFAVDENGNSIPSALYSVALNLGEGGTVTFSVPPTLAEYVALFIVNAPAMTQESDFGNAGPSFNPVAITRAFDRAAIRDLFLQAQIDRAIKFPFGDTGLSLPAQRAGLYLSFDVDSNPVASSGTGADVGLRTDIAARNGSAFVGFQQSGVGAKVAAAEAKMREWISVEDFYTVLDASHAPAFQRAINEANARGGGEVRALGSAYIFHQSVILKTGVRITGLGRAQATITKTAHTFSAFTDNGVALAFVDISGFKIRCATAGASGESDRGILFDTQGTPHTGFVRVHDMAFENMFRGIEIDHVDHFEYDNIDGADILDSLIYVGEVKEFRSGYVKAGRVTGLRCLSSKGSDVGGGVVVLSYVDEIGPGDYRFVDCGPNDVTASINKFHGLYLRTCGDGDWGIVRGFNQRSGAHLHIFSDIAAGEPRSGNHIGILVSNGTTTYYAARISGGTSVTFKPSTEISNSWFNAVFIDDYYTVTMVGRPRMINNNRSNTSGSRDAAAVLIASVKAIKLDLYCYDDLVKTYGQAGIVAFQGVCDTADVSGYIECLDAIADYAVISHESGSLVKYPSYHDIISIGSKNFLDEAGTVTPAGQGSVGNINIVTAGGGPLLTVEQMHRIKVAPNCYQGGMRFGYWSDGKNVWLWANAHPSVGAWVAGDEWKRMTPAASGVDGGVCVVAGTPGTWKHRAPLEA